LPTTGRRLLMCSKERGRMCMEGVKRKKEEADEQ